MKSKFQNLNFEGVEVLSREEKTRVVGGYIPPGGIHYGGNGGSTRFLLCKVNFGTLNGNVEEEFDISIPFSSCGSLSQRVMECESEGRNRGNYSTKIFTHVVNAFGCHTH